MSALDPRPTPREALLSVARAPEFFSFLLLVAAFAIAASMSEYFLDARYLLESTSLCMEIGLMALAMTFVIVAGHIDLSCAGILALVAGVAAWLHARAGLPMELMLALCPLMGAALGAANGALVAGLGLPSLVVTLGTMALYRGGAKILLGDGSVSLPTALTGIDYVFVPGTWIPAPLVAFLVLAVLAGLLLHQTTFGRAVIILGTNPEAARLAGLPTRRDTVLVFALSGLAAGLAAALLCSRLGVARWDHARGWELDVITVVVLGGASIAGGRGTIAGTVIALFLVAVLRRGSEERQLAAVGALLIVGVALSNAAAALGKARSRRVTTPAPAPPS